MLAGLGSTGLLGAGPERKKMELKVGDRIKDNDPRMGENRVLEIIEVLPNVVRAVDSMGKVRRYLRKAIHTDGKTRRTGFSLVPNAQVTGAASSRPVD